MALDPELTPILELFEVMGVPDPRTVTPQQLRESLVMPPPENPTPVGGIENLSIEGPGGAVPIRIYRPGNTSAGPVLMYFHGGGWVIGDLETHDETCRRLCAGSGAVVVSVDYRLAPEQPFPAGLEDCYAATAWAGVHAAELGGDPARLVVAGDSAGGNLAAAVCLLARERGGPAIAHQVLIYPVADNDFSTASYIDNADGYFLTRDMMMWFWEQYLADPGDAANPLAAPMNADLAGLPSATVITAGYDPLRDEGIALAGRLAGAGVDVEQREFEGMIHGFIGMTDALTQARLALDYLCQRIQDRTGG
jgi:acetyl esterase